MRFELEMIYSFPRQTKMKGLCARTNNSSRVGGQKREPEPVPGRQAQGEVSFRARYRREREHGREVPLCVPCAARGMKIAGHLFSRVCGL
jgi:hypothetical protein